MGCHTWAYKRIGSLNDFAPRKKLIKSFQEEKKETQYDIINSDCDEAELKINKGCIRYCDRVLKILKDECRYKNLKEESKCRLFDNVAWRIFPEEDEWLDYRCYDGFIYERVTEFGNNMFRISEYDLKMTSYEETLKILDKYYDKNNIYRGGILNMDKIKEFWNKYPDGLITTG